ncbi:hypothetical protein A2118_00895 [Candidatus Kaiserbacteria bacterium GWA2_50_9]|uniref:Uncharacterized protein n=1 Tax=Candidatus Kaiserbacteria bacterium GWA2_50_9 TaxID=1798474 RepID=A0A1F6BUJ4_9BACT|nr:MAG: hypothetical protein A2118_00895 [Candidatus Kaiserbacteria bacterium GWA2_50_9]
MTHRNETEYQNIVKAKLELLYSEVEVQWRPFRGEGRGIYAPIVDIAVGPFAIEAQYGNRYAELLTETHDFIDRLIEKHNANVEDDDEQTSFRRVGRFNRNARCLLCIEIEDSGGRKHCLGDLVNASALGRIGLLVARSKKTLKVFLRQRVYLNYLKSVRKNTFRTDNALVLTEAQFDECLDAIGKRTAPSP